MKRLAWPAVSREHYLNTSIIDTYLALLSEHISASGGDTQMHIVSPMISLNFFPTAYGPHAIDGVINLGAIRHMPDPLVFPLNTRGTEHWWSVVFNFGTQEIRAYNSSSTPARNTRKYMYVPFKYLLLRSCLRCTTTGSGSGQTGRSPASKAHPPSLTL